MGFEGVFVGCALLNPPCNWRAQWWVSRCSIHPATPKAISLRIRRHPRGSGDPKKGCTPRLGKKSKRKYSCFKAFSHPNLLHRERDRLLLSSFSQGLRPGLYSCRAGGAQMRNREPVKGKQFLTWKSKPRWFIVLGHITSIQFNRNP